MNKKFIEYNVNIFVPFFIGSVILYLLNYFFDLVNIFGNSDSYVYYYTFSTIVQGYVALVAFLGTLAVFKLQRDENRKSPGAGRVKNFFAAEGDDGPGGDRVDGQRRAVGRFVAAPPASF